MSDTLLVLKLVAWVRLLYPLTVLEVCTFSAYGPLVHLVKDLRDPFRAYRSTRSGAREEQPVQEGSRPSHRPVCSQRESSLALRVIPQIKTRRVAYEFAILPPGIDCAKLVLDGGQLVRGLASALQLFELGLDVLELFLDAGKRHFPYGE